MSGPSSFSRAIGIPSLLDSSEVIVAHGRIRLTHGKEVIEIVNDWWDNLFIQDPW